MCWLFAVWTLLWLFNTSPLNNVNQLNIESIQNKTDSPQSIPIVILPLWYQRGLWSLHWCYSTFWTSILCWDILSATSCIPWTCFQESTIHHDRESMALRAWVSYSCCIGSQKKQRNPTMYVRRLIITSYMPNTL